MKFAKYTAILLALILLYSLVRLVWAIVERGLPTQPVYYLALVVGIGLGFLNYKLFTFLPLKLANTKLKKAKLVLILPLALMAFCIVVPIVLYNSNITILRTMSGAQFWYFISFIGLWLYWMIKRARAGTELTEAEQTHEYALKGLSLSLLIIASLFLLVFLILFLIISLSTC
jgi:hypothetical protein